MLSIAIQAGGKSRRMGSDKALVQLGEKPLIEHVLEAVKGLGDEILITSNHPEGLSYLGIPLVADPVPGAGALTGLQTALEAAKGDRVLVLACDMPFTNRTFIEFLIEYDPSADVVVPYHSGFFEPLHAIYSKACLPAIETSLIEGNTRVISFFDQVQTRRITEDQIAKLDPAKMAFFNINTPEDLEIAEQHLSQLSDSKIE
jgi:molybdopterin-guanine dinucleotide biosynthesis protein A